MRATLRPVAIGLGFLWAFGTLLSPLSAQGLRPRARLILQPNSALGECVCELVLRDQSGARTCDGRNALEQVASHSNGEQLVCSSLSLIDIATHDGRCNLSGPDMPPNSCAAQLPSTCVAKYRFQFAVHSTACHEHAPNGFWILRASQPSIRIFRSVGTSIDLDLILTPACGSCADESFLVALPDGAHGMPGTVLYRYMVAADCANCLSTQSTLGAGDAR